MKESGTAVFTDIVGFTEFTAVQGDSAAVALLARQEVIVSRSLPAGARVVKELGDGLLLAFADSCVALETCLALQEQFADAASDETPLWVRVGMHSGPLTRRGADLVGNTVNIAARIVDVAGPGEVLVSNAVEQAVRARPAPAYQFEQLGPVIMKGVPEPIPLFRALRRSRSRA